jgi:hypothetical protein
MAMSDRLIGASSTLMGKRKPTIRGAACGLIAEHGANALRSGPLRAELRQFRHSARCGLWSRQSFRGPM